MAAYRFVEVNVFSADPLAGNPLAVVHAAEGLSEARMAALDPLKLGVVGPHEAGGDAEFEVRAFIGGGGYEDPVTGSLNASLAQWLIGAGLAGSSYVASQGGALERAGRVHLRQEGGEVWVGGDVVEVVRGGLVL